MLGRGLWLKTTILLVSILCGLLADFQYGFRSSWSTADPLTVVSDRTARVFNRAGATLAVALDITKAFNKVWHTGPLHKLKI